MSSNPLIKQEVYENVIQSDRPMSVSGTINKTLILTLVMSVCAYLTWQLCAYGYSDKALLLTGVGAISAFICALIAAFRPQNSPILAPFYALCEGLALGAISFAYASLYDGIVINALCITIITLFSMLLLYKSRVIAATERFKRVVFTATLAIGIFYLIDFVCWLKGTPLNIFNGSITGIVLNFVICIFAALNFIRDFDFIERGSNSFAPSYFEWYGGMMLLVTVVWLYLEILRLLAQLSKRD